MATIGQLIRKLAQGDEKLVESEIQQLERALVSFENYSGIVRSNSEVGSPKLRVEFPFETIYSQILQVDSANVEVAIPSTYNTVVIYGSGSITGANGGNIWAQFNGDTASNYTWQFIKGDGATVSSTHDTADPYVALGVFGTTGAGAGVNGSFRAEIIHSQGQWKKNVLSHAYTAEFNDLYLLGGTWQNTAPIQRIEIFATDNTLAKGSASLAAGSLFSVYGLR